MAKIRLYIEDQNGGGWLPVRHLLGNGCPICNGNVTRYFDTQRDAHMIARFETFCKRYAIPCMTVKK